MPDPGVDPLTESRGVTELPPRLGADMPADRILDPTGQPYLERYHLTHTRDRSVRYHHWLGSDHQRAMHDHPWDSVTVVLAGHLIEHTPHGDRDLHPGDVVIRHARDPHALELDSDDAWTVFTTGPLTRTWGFHTATGWTHWRAYPHAGTTHPLPGHPLPPRL